MWNNSRIKIDESIKYFKNLLNSDEIMNKKCMERELIQLTYLIGLLTRECTNDQILAQRSDFPYFDKRNHLIYSN